MQQVTVEVDSLPEADNHLEVDSLLAEGSWLLSPVKGSPPEWGSCAGAGKGSQTGKDNLSGVGAEPGSLHCREVGVPVLVDEGAPHVITTLEAMASLYVHYTVTPNYLSTLLHNTHVFMHTDIYTHIHTCSG